MLCCCRTTTQEDLKKREVHGADLGSMVAYKWWLNVDHVATKDGKLRRCDAARWYLFWHACLAITALPCAHKGHSRQLVSGCCMALL